MNKKKLSLEQQKKSLILKRLEGERRMLIVAGRNIARLLYQTLGEPITAGLVFEEMLHVEVWRSAMMKLDKRWLGCVFTHKEWEIVGHAPFGSHGRYVALWRPLR